MNQDQKHYFAFISHSSADEKIAKWLRRKLEGFYIPTTIQKDFHAPKKLKPIFLYQTDLAGNQLRGALNSELDDSQYLIVICSPSAAKSYFVNEEVKNFIKSGRCDKIIPFIVKGTPFASLKGKADEECFPPALVALKGTDDELRGIDIHEEKKQRGLKMAAVIDVIATMLGVRFDVLWNIYIWRIIRQYSLKALLALLFIFLGYLIWEYYRPIYRYYADYVDKWGIPEGIIELDESTLKHRYRSYKFEYHRIPLGATNALSWRTTPTKVEYINSAGQPQDYLGGVMYDRYAIMQITYNSSGSINHIDLCNKSGKTILRWKISSYDGQKAALIDFLGTSDIDASGYLGAITTISKPQADLRNIHKSSIKRFFFQRDSDGYIVSKSYHSSNADDLRSSRTADANGVHKQVFINDSLGRAVKVIFYDLYGNISTRGSGVAIQKYKYDSWGNYCQVDFLDSQETPILGEQQCARITSISDHCGNIIEKSYWGPDGRLCFNQDNIAEEKMSYNEKGYPLSVTYYDNNRLLCRHKEGFARLIIKCDSRGNQIEYRFEDMSKKPCANIHGLAKYTAEYDRWGNQIYMAYYGLNGRLIRNNQGFAGQNNKYDKHGNCTQIDFFDENWNACSNIMGFATLKTDYDEIGYPTRYTFLDIKGEKTLCNKGFASCTYQYERGNPVEIAYFNTKDMPCTNVGGFHKVRYKFDALGNETEFAYYDTIGNLCIANEHFAYCKILPDSLGNTQKCTYYDIDHQPTKDNHGVCTYFWTYDNFGRVTSVRFLDENNNPIINQEGIAGWNAKYDIRGHQIEYSNIDVNGYICYDSSGIASWKKEFDQRGNQVSYTAYNKHNHPKSSSNGIASWKSIFDIRGQLISTSYFDENGSPCMNKDIGYSRYETQYDTNLNQIEICTYDNHGNLCIDPKYGFAKWVAHYNEKGEKVEMLSFSEKDSLCVCKYGYARWVASYNKDGYITKSYSYDARGNVISNNKIEERDKDEYLIKKYDSHRFQYDVLDLILGFLFFAGLLFFIGYMLTHITSYNFKFHLFSLACIIIIAGIDYLYLREFLLHYSLIPYEFYNYSWILCLVSALLCSTAAVFILRAGGDKIISIIKSNQYTRRSEIKESKGFLIFCLIVIAIVLYLTYILVEEGWTIYSNPL